MMNSKKSRFKLSKVEYKMNRLVVSILGVQLTLCLIVSLIDITWYKDNHMLHSFYLDMNDTVGSNFI